MKSLVSKLNVAITLNRLIILPNDFHKFPPRGSKQLATSTGDLPAKSCELPRPLVSDQLLASFIPGHVLSLAYPPDH